MDGIGGALFSGILTVAFVVIIVASAISVGVTYFATKTDYIKSEHLIKPEIELIIKDNKVDTVYVYKKP